LGAAQSPLEKQLCCISSSGAIRFTVFGFRATMRGQKRGERSMGATQEITVSSQLKSANAVSDIENHSGLKNREKYRHKNPDIDTTKSHLNAEFDLFDRMELLGNHYQEIIEKHNKNNNSAARKWDLEKYLATFEGKTVKRMGKETQNARWATATQVSYFGGKDSLNPVLEALEDAGASPEEIREAYLSGYEEYVQRHNETFPTLPIYHSDVHFDETTPHGHDAIVVMGHTAKGRPSDSINNALGEMYGYKSGFKGNQENMARYREENDGIMFDAIGSKLEALGSAYGMDFEFEFIRTGQTESHSYEDYKIKKDFESQAEELQETEQQLEFRSKAQKKISEKNRDRKRELDARENALNARESDLGLREGSVIAREREIREKEQEVAARENKVNRLLLAETEKFKKLNAVATAVALGVLEGDPMYRKWVDLLNEKGAAGFKPAALVDGLSDSIQRIQQGKRPRIMSSSKESINQRIAQQEAKRNDGPSL